MRTLLGTLALGAFLAISSFPAAAETVDPVIGTWELNPAKSTRSAPMHKSEIRTYAAAPDGVALTWERVNADGTKSMVKSTYKYDGKDYPVTGSPDFDAISAKRIDANTVETTQKRMGKKVGTVRRTVSADGKTLTVNQRFTPARENEFGALIVFDRQ